MKKHKAGKQHRGLSLERRNALYGNLFASTVVLGVVLFFVPALIQSLRLSFFQLNVSILSASKWVGLDNYYYVLGVEPNFRKVLLSSIVDMMVNVPVVVVFSLFIATLMNQRFFGRALFRALLFLPVIISSGIIIELENMDIVTSAISSESVSRGASLATVFSGFLTNLNISTALVSFLTDIVSRIYDITVMSAIPVLILLAGLQSISPSIFEAAYMEGATQWEVFWKISFPMVSPLMLAACVYSVVDSFTSVANPVINAIHTTTFTNTQYGRGTAMAWCYMLIVFAAMGIAYMLVNRYVHYAD